MKIVIIGGSGLIGRKLIPLLKSLGHDVASASPSSGVNAVTGEGLAAALQGAEVVVDVSNSPSFADEAVMHFFATSTQNLLTAEAAAGVRHHVALSVVGADRIPAIGYLRAKVVQENLIRAGSVPYSILRATQFYEFLGVIADGCTVGDAIRLPLAPIQPLAADDVALELSRVVSSGPTNRVSELAGPESLPMAEFIRKYLAVKGDKREVIADPNASYFGAVLDHLGLNPGENPRLGSVTFEEWRSQQS